jgi:hypothetical protein
MCKDLIIGSFTNYDWSKIQYWANSIDACGFQGDKAMLVYNADRNTVQQLSNRGFKIMGFNHDPQTGNLFYNAQLIVVVERFLHLHGFLENLMQQQHYRYVIHTDVKDVVFQRNPSEWLDANMGTAKILASCESLEYQHEPWGNENLQNSFPWVYHKLKSQPIWNCGVQAGVPSVMKDLWLNIYLLSVGSQHATKVHNPDQAAYNVLLNLEPYSSMTKFVMSEDAWACQAGTTVDPAKMQTFMPHLLEPQPLWDGHYATTSRGTRHYVLHQYDRIPAWKPVVEARYAG